MEELVARNPFGFVLTQDVVFNRMEEDLKQLKNKQKLRRVSIAPAKTQPEDADAENDGQGMVFQHLCSLKRMMLILFVAVHSLP